MPDLPRLEFYDRAPRRFAASGPEVSMTSVDVVLKAFERADEVRGDQPYISVHFMGSEHYAR